MRGLKDLMSYTFIFLSIPEVTMYLPGGEHNDIALWWTKRKPQFMLTNAEKWPNRKESERFKATHMPVLSTATERTAPW